MDQWQNETVAQETLSAGAEHIIWKKMSIYVNGEADYFSPLLFQYFGLSV